MAYIENEKILGMPAIHTLFGHILPNILYPLFTSMGNRAGGLDVYKRQAEASKYSSGKLENRPYKWLENWKFPGFPDLSNFILSDQEFY